MEFLPVKVDGFAYGGESFGRLPDGRVCFFRGGVPGDEVLVEIVASKRSYARGFIRKIITASSDRIAPKCPSAVHPGRGVFCSGCSYQQVDYPLEVQWKQRQLSDFIVRSGIAGAEVMQLPVSSPSRFNWRNRLKLSRSGDNIGFFAEDNVTIVPVERCPLAVEELNESLAFHCKRIMQDELFFRWSAADGVVVNGGSKMLTEELPGIGTFKVPASSFFQTNTQVAALLVKEVCRILEMLDVKKMCELYCGVGVFSLAAAKELPMLETLGVEIDAGAIRNAKENARLWGVGSRCHFFAGKAERMRRKDFGTIMPDVLLLDPPRRGVASGVLNSIKQWKIPHVIYVSCAPDSLARDLRNLCEVYKVEQCRLFDMFPCTGHFETLVLLNLK